MQLDALRLPWPAEPRHDQPHHRPGHYVATVTQSMEGGLVEDDCVVDLTTSQHRSTARTHHKDYPQRDGEVAFEHASQDVRDTALMAIHHLTLNGHLFPAAVSQPGVLTAQEVMSVADLTTSQRRAERWQRQQAAYHHEAANPSPIVQEARTQRLVPEPVAPGQWRARCPGTNHSLLIQPPIEKFYCGYCRRGGTAEDLIAFCDERRSRVR